MFADGNTNIAEGLAWGWRVISPTEPFTKVEGTSSIPASTISPYNDVRWQKIMVLMTDGANNVGTGISYSGSSYGAYGRGSQVLATNRYGTTNSSNWNSTLDTNLTTICTSMKAKGILIYATGFNLSNSSADTAIKNRLKACAFLVLNTTLIQQTAWLCRPSSTTSAKTCSTSRSTSADKTQSQQSGGVYTAAFLLPRPAARSKLQKPRFNP